MIYFPTSTSKERRRWRCSWMAVLGRWLMKLWVFCRNDNCWSWHWTEPYYEFMHSGGKRRPHNWAMMKKKMQSDVLCQCCSSRSYQERPHSPLWGLFTIIKNETLLREDKIFDKSFNSRHFPKHDRMSILDFHMHFQIQALLRKKCKLHFLIPPIEWCRTSILQYCYGCWYGSVTCW